MTLNLPLYNITPDMDDVNQGMFLVSLVEDPAVEIDFIAFAKENMLFAVQDTDKHIVTGVSILADTPIYRRTKNGEFYVQFRKEDIPAIVEKFMQRGLSNFINIQHDETTLSNTDAVLVESYFINKERGIVPNEFANVTDGSWITSYKIMNDEIWEQIKNGDLKGFSIEISAELEPVKLEKQKTEEEQMDEELMTNCFASAEAAAAETASSIINKPFEETINYNPNVMDDASIRGAITGKNVVILNYTGTDAPGLREVTITAYGSLANGDAIRVFQWYGDTSSSNKTWKFMLTDEISGFKVLPVVQEAPYHDVDTGVGGVGHFDSIYLALEKE